MPLSQPAIHLDPGPGCVKQARLWVGDALRELGREELVETAELGVSELVGNALLHARAPIRLRMRGTQEHPRVEVLDGSHQPPTPPVRLPDGEHLTTVGRGLEIVAMTATAWGADIDRQGKVVWFEPAPSMAEEPTVAGDIFHAEPPLPPDTDVDEGLSVVLQDLPVDLYAETYVQHQELRRELRLLSLAHGETYPIASSISRVFRSFDEQLHRSGGTEALDAALEGEVVTKTIDATLVVPSTLPHTASRMIDMLELADTFCRSERLLSLATSPDQRAFRRWYLGEFVRQGDGEAPMPWSDELLGLDGDGHTA
ncbi:ATP-binding protein [Nocardioides jiangxiensis]|uniref:ATP-binding protein n=1 Tax=Nocardioides jiangxiensis TaxID=3064524 RepID=A0ABT9AZ75_9ACTN|nr:ATP-binding protein [Nocardioides sp. WY-20]MDO7867889.1 ATP-binding protein [Nocardioides sp. WY-20]